jgi:hypothetical protein
LHERVHRLRMVRAKNSPSHVLVRVQCSRHGRDKTVPGRGRRFSERRSSNQKSAACSRLSERSWSGELATMPWKVNGLVDGEHAEMESIGRKKRGMVQTRVTAGGAQSPVVVWV